MATATKQTSLDKVQSVAVENGWDVQVEMVPLTIKDPTPGNGIGYGRRRGYVPRVQVNAWRVRLDNGTVTNQGHYGSHYGAVVMTTHFTEDGKYLAEATKSNGYHVYSGSPLKDVLNVLERLAPAVIQAERNRREAEQAERAAKQVAQAEEDVENAQHALDKATVEARKALAVVGVCDDDMDEALRILQGPLWLYGFTAERRKEADQNLARIKAEQARV